MLPAPLHAAGSHDGLPTRADSNVLMHNLDRLLAATADAIERKQPVLKRAHHAS